jgi:hypothetical protein
MFAKFFGFLSDCQRMTNERARITSDTAKSALRKLESGETSSNGMTPWSGRRLANMKIMRSIANGQKPAAIRIAKPRNAPNL